MSGAFSRLKATPMSADTIPVTTEIVRRVHCPEAFLEVGEWPESPDAVELRSTGAQNISYFGQINLTMTPQFALQLGQALVQAAIDKGAS